MGPKIKDTIKAVKVARIALTDKNSMTLKGPKKSVRHSNIGNNILRL